MKNGTKIRIVRWIAIPVVILGLRFADGSRIWNYMVDHLWLAAVLPLVALFLILLVRGMQYRRMQGGNAKMGAHGAKS